MSIEPIRLALSLDRLRPYEAAMGADRTRGLELYEWHMEVSAALFEALGAAEVILRNAVHDRLAPLHKQAGRSRHR